MLKSKISTKISNKDLDAEDAEDEMSEGEKKYINKRKAFQAISKSRKDKSKRLHMTALFPEEEKNEKESLSEIKSEDDSLSNEENKDEM